MVWNLRTDRSYGDMRMKHRLMNPVLPKTLMLGDSHRIKLCRVVGAMLAGSVCILSSPPPPPRHSLSIIFRKAVSETFTDFLTAFMPARCFLPDESRRGLFVLQWDFLTACQPFFVPCARELGLRDKTGQDLRT